MPTTQKTTVPAQRGSRFAPRTRKVTLYRLIGGSSLNDALDWVSEALLGLNPSVTEVSIADAPAVVIHAPGVAQAADWCADLSTTTGLDVNYESQRPGGLLFVDVDGIVYGVSYGTGHLWLDAAVKDSGFGLRFIVRCLDSDQVKDVVRRVPGARGRTDSTLVPGGAPIWHLEIDRLAEIVRRLGGQIAEVPLTAGRLGTWPITAEGAAGLRIRIGIEPHDLVDDIRAIATVCRQDNPHPDLAFVENVVPVTSTADVDRLDEVLEDGLGSQSPAGLLLTVAAPEAALASLPFARNFGLKIGSARCMFRELRLEDFLRRLQLQPAGHRLQALRNGSVQMWAGEDGTDSLGSSKALHWIEASASLEQRRFVLVDGSWYELGTAYVEEVRGYVERLLQQPLGAITLPAWRVDEHEGSYNLRVGDAHHGFLCLDRRGVTTGLHRGNGVEICDLLGPDDELIHVKRASSSAPLSHLFTQGVVSAQSLLHHPEARKQFAEVVLKHGRGRTIPQDFTPKKIVFAILLKEGEQVSVDTLFPFAQVALRKTAMSLEGKVDLEVVAIHRETT